MTCEHCKKEFMPKQRYCGAACRVASHRNGSVTSNYNVTHKRNDSVTKKNDDTEALQEPKPYQPIRYSTKNGQCGRHGRKDCFMCK